MDSPFSSTNPDPSSSIQNPSFICSIIGKFDVAGLQAWFKPWSLQIYIWVKLWCFNDTLIARDVSWKRLLGKKVIFIIGTDENEEKIATAAASASSPSEHRDVISQAYKELWKDLDIAYDKFIQTTESKHEAIVKEFYSKVLASGDIYLADYEGLYCVNCEEYKARCKCLR